MSRNVVFQASTGATFAPSSNLGNVSSPKDFFTFDDPNGHSGVSLGVGDLWYDLMPATLPPFGSYKPDASTTGYQRTGVTLTPYPATGGPAGNIVNGILTINTPNVTLDSYNFPCQIVVRAANVTIKRSYVRGNNVLPNNSALIECQSASVVNCLVQDCLLVPDYPSIWWDGIIGHDYTAIRNHVYHTVDGFGIYNNTTVKTYANVALYGNFVHDLSFFSPDPNHSDTPVSHTHNDCVQIQGGQNITAIGNHLSAYCATDTLSRDGSSTPDILRSSTNPNSLGGYNARYPILQANAALQLSTGVAPVDFLIWDKNWMYGGGYTMNMVGMTVGSNSHASDNRFGHDQSFETGGDTTHTIVGGGTAMQNASSGNVYDDNGVPVLWRQTP